MDSPQKKQSVESVRRMNHPEKTGISIHELERLSQGASFIHRLDARTKILATLIYLVALLSLPSDDLFGGVAFLLYPIVVVSLANLPAGYLLKRSLIALPFVLFIGIFNPILDHTPALSLGNITISRGWLSFAVIVERSILSVLAALILVATTGFPQICSGLKKLGVPSVMTTQLVFVFRYLFLLVQEASEMRLSAKLRNPSTQAISLKTWGNMIGSLLLRTLDRAERIHTALMARGFDGDLKIISYAKFGKIDLLYLSFWTFVLFMIRFCDPVRFIGGAIHSLLP